MTQTVRPGYTHLFIGTALAVLMWATLAAGETGAPQHVTSRPFDHLVHDALLCTECHGAGEQHRTLRVRTPQDCASCHHAPERSSVCTRCHDAESLPEPGTVRAELSLSVAPAALLVRELPFGHELHAEVACRDCHSTAVTLAPDRRCQSCHEAHHRADRNCAACHQPPQQPVHDAAAHLSCAGAGCHAPSLAPEPALSRMLCLVCHAAQQDHEAGSACASCHLLLEDGGVR